MSKTKLPDVLEKVIDPSQINWDATETQMEFKSIAIYGCAYIHAFNLHLMCFIQDQTITVAEEFSSQEEAEAYVQIYNNMLEDL